MLPTAPVKLTSARAWRTYIGGSQIDAIHGISGSQDSQFPEEWILSTVTARNAGREHIQDEGLSYVEGADVSLRALIESGPEKLLGKAHFESVGPTTGVLVKIIDAGERLTLQVHPDKETAMRLFHSPFGKTECWHILGGREIGGEKPCIYMGFKEGITRGEWKRCFDEQDIPAMLQCLHRFEVQPGETYLIRGGVPHAIGAGCLLVEIQEPTDYTIRTERVTPAGLTIADSMLHQGLGFDTMFDCFHYEGMTKEEAYRRFCIPAKTLEENADYTQKVVIGAADTPCFRLERYDISGEVTLPASDVFSGLYVLCGTGVLKCEGAVTALAGGQQYFLPATCAPFTLTADPEHPITLFRCFGPEE